MPTPDGFPSAWHRDRYIHDLRRSVADAERRLADPKLDQGDKAVWEAEKRISLAELERLGEQR